MGYYIIKSKARDMNVFEDGMSKILYRWENISDVQSIPELDEPHN
jgi:hypothetical protein